MNTHYNYFGGISSSEITSSCSSVFPTYMDLLVTSINSSTDSLLIEAEKTYAPNGNMELDIYRSSSTSLCDSYSTSTNKITVRTYPIGKTTIGVNAKSFESDKYAFEFSRKVDIATSDISLSGTTWFGSSSSLHDSIFDAASIHLVCAGTYNSICVDAACQGADKMYILCINASGEVEFVKAINSSAGYYMKSGVFNGEYTIIVIAQNGDKIKCISKKYTKE